jgi:chromosome segregation ATPase
MPSHGEIPKQPSQVLDVVPEEMQNHFQEMSALREEFKALRVDLQQAQRRVDLYKGLADDSQTRAERYQRKLADAAKQQTATDEANETIERLQAELEDQQAITIKLSQEYCANNKIAEQKDAIIAEKEVVIATIVAYTHQLEKEKLQLEQDKVALKNTFEQETDKLKAAMADGEQVSAACESLIETLEQETHSATNAVNRNSLVNDAFMEQIAPLNRFYNHIYSVLSTYKGLFQKLSDPNFRIGANLSKSLDFGLDAALKELNSFQAVAKVSGDGLAQGRVCMQVDNMAKTAGNMYVCLEDIRDNVLGFMSRLRNDPGSRGRLQVVPTTQNASVASFASLLNSYRGGSHSSRASRS